MNKTSITDITVKQSGINSGHTLSFREKIELAKLLDSLMVDVIELNPIDNEKLDTLLIKSVCSAVKNSAVAVPVGLKVSGIETVWNAIKEAKSPRLQVEVPVSDVQMEYIAGKKPAAMLETVKELVSICKEKCNDVEFIADDATRSNEEFLAEIISAAIDSGANTVTVCDTSGTSLPNEFGEFIKKLYAAVPKLKEVKLGVSSSNELAMSDASVIAAVLEGAAEIKAASYGVNSASLLNVVNIITSKPEIFKTECSVETTKLNSIITEITELCGREKSKTSPFDSGFKSENGMSLSAKDDITAVTKAIVSLGYELSAEDNTKVFEEFSKIASRKETVSTRELDKIIASVALQVPPTYRLDSYVINTGNTISATAHIKLIKSGVTLEGISLGDGPIDAAFLAIEKILGHHFELDDFQIQSVTEGREAMGESVVKLRSNGKLYSGRGISTDIVGASINAYINALNKIVYEESAN